MQNTYSVLRAGRIYHVYTRGNNRENLFKREENYPYFLRLWEHHISAIAETYAYCLMPNHVHFCVAIKAEEELPDPYKEGKKSLSQPFSNCFNAYTKAINKRYERIGSLFQKNYRRKEVVDNAYLVSLITYIHANPQNHGICEDFREYPYSSYRSYYRPSRSINLEGL